MQPRPSAAEASLLLMLTSRELNQDVCILMAGKINYLPRTAIKSADRTITSETMRGAK